jgi:hypothetical protein
MGYSDDPSIRDARWAVHSLPSAARVAFGQHFLDHRVTNGSKDSLINSGGRAVGGRPYRRRGGSCRGRALDVERVG